MTTILVRHAAKNLRKNKKSGDKTLLWSIGDGSQKVFERKRVRPKPAAKPKIPDRLSAAEQLRKAKEAAAEEPVETTD